MRIDPQNSPYPYDPPPHARAVLQSEDLLLLSPETKLRVLDRVFLRFDDLVAQHTGALKIETVGGVYLVAANGALCRGAPGEGFCKALNIIGTVMRGP